MVTSIDADTLQSLLEKRAPVIDVLGEESYRHQHIPGAVNVPIDSDHLEDRLQEVAPEKDRPVVVYCRDPHCEASPAAAHILEEHLDYTDVRHFPGGLVGWRRSGRALDGDGPKRLHMEDLTG